MNKISRLLTIWLFFVLAYGPNVQADISEKVEFSGFARVIGGLTDTGDALYKEYDNKLSFSNQSLIALQADVEVTNTIGLSGQLLAHSSDTRDSGVEWLYLTYQPSSNWRFKAGKLRTPFFRYSDVIDVGLAYPWITPPEQVYSGSLFSNYEGASATYRFDIKQINIDIEAYKGTYTGDFSRNNQEVPLDIDNIQGLILNANYGNFSMRASISVASEFFADFPGFSDFANALEFAGFKQNADSLRFDGSANSYQANVNYDTLDYFLAAEWVKTTSDLFVVPQIDAYYLTAGYNFFPFQVHATYSVSDSSYNISDNLIPKGVSPQLDFFSFTYDQITTALPSYPLKSLSVGLRWDFKSNMAAKAEVTFLDGEANADSFFSDFTDPNFDRQATLYQVGVEWVF